MARRTLLVFFLSAFWLVLGLFRPLEVYDEGIALVGGMRILDGYAPYRDYYAIYTPGQYYLTAVAQWLLGPSVMAERLVSLLVRASIATLGFVLARRAASASWAWCGWVLVLAWLSFFSFFSNSSFSGLLFSLAAIAAVTAPIPSGAARDLPRRLLVGGGLCGAAFLFRQDFGVYACAGQLSVLACRAFTEPTGGRHALGAMARGTALFGAGFLVVVALPAAYFVREVGAERMFHALFVWPLELTSEYRSLPWPGLNAPKLSMIAERLPFYAAPLTYLLVGLGSGLRLLRGPRDSSMWCRLHLVLFGVFVLNQALRRSDLMHIAPTHLTALILLPALLEAIVRALPRAAARAVVLVVVLSLAWAPANTFVRDSLPALTRAKGHGIERARYVPLAKDQALALHFIRERTGPDDAIYVGNWSHDVVIWNDIAFYFLAERKIPTAHYKFDPGYTTSEDVQRQIASDLEGAGVRWVVLYGLSRFVVEPNRSAVPDSRLLDEYLAEQYEPAATFGNYRILQRKRP